MKKNKREPTSKRYFIIHESIFNRPVHVFLNYTHKEFAKWTGDKKYIEQDDGKFDENFAGCSSEIQKGNEPLEWVIQLKHFDWTIKDQGSLIHEIVHTIVKIWNLNNIKWNGDTQEFLAHEVGNLYEDIAAKIFNKKKKLR